MKKEFNLDTTIGKSMLSRLGLVASIAVTAPLLIALSTPVQANHKVDSKDQSQNATQNANQNAANNAADEATPVKPVVRELPKFGTL